MWNASCHAAWPNVDDAVITAWRTLALTGGARTRTTVCTKERRCALVALHRLPILALLVDTRASAERNTLQGETTMPFYERGDVRIHYEEVGSGFPLMIMNWI